MATVPVRPSIAAPYRKLLVSLERRVGLPDVNPCHYDVLAILLSAVFPYAQTSPMKTLVLGTVLLADWLDGATARRFGKQSKSGYVIDVVTDRVSEALIFMSQIDTAVGSGLFLLWIFNTMLAFCSMHFNRHWSLPLRFVYLVVLVIGS